MDDNTVQKLQELDLNSFIRPHDLLARPSLFVELPFQTFGTHGRLLLAVDFLKTGTKEYFEFLESQVEEIGGALPQELLVHTRLAAQSFANVACKMWLLWRQAEYARLVPASARSQTATDLIPAFAVLGGDEDDEIRNACDALDESLWPATRPDITADQKQTADCLLRRAINALGHGIVTQPSSKSAILSLFPVWQGGFDFELQGKWFLFSKQLRGSELALFGWLRQHNRVGEFEAILRLQDPFSVVFILERLHEAALVASRPHINDEPIRPRKRQRVNPLIQ
ncbi:hypothetical protein A4X13_0g8602 [Tilletia indica]|uniref:Uncharacterized protein n=1 Tax=Tilletia indica TaxID=43049 RepID=A0A177T2B0_9BASI|nr:hypothetical protein A4X13_0g8602 [Tilletia indica]